MHSSIRSQPPQPWTIQLGGLRFSGWQSQTADQPPSAAPMLCLHGWLDNAASFLPLAAELHDHTLWAAEWAGHGHSDHRCGGSFLQHLEELDAYIHAMPPEPVTLLGHSMGGALACLYAAAFPERVRRLALIESLGPMAQPADRFPAELRRALEARRGHADRRRAYPDFEALVQARLQASPMRPESARLLLERGTERVSEGYRFRSDPGETLPSLVRATEDQVLAALHAIRCPVLLILADPATRYLDGPAAQRRIEALRPVAVHRMVGQHHLHMDTPQEVAAHLRAFWRATA